ncbi:cytosine deaminase [Anoxynatronum sibiricum]|uniref:Cytosine deaminase n=1 Tax=Anoxynatronum sibiricum TaxID=210623 RepID=A0ABU9VRV6_9CLOT
MRNQLIIKNAKLRDRDQLVHIAVDQGLICQISTYDETDAHEPIEAHEIVDARGALVVPAFVQPHVHLDSALTAGEPRENVSGTLYEAIHIWSCRQQQITREDVAARALKSIRWHVGQGALFIRSHVDICDQDLTAVKALLEVKEQVAPQVQLQLVAFPQEGIMDYPQALELMEEALKMGVDGVGGTPHLEFTREEGIESINRVFDLAEKYDCFVDIHCDETDDDQSRFLEHVALQAYRRGYGPRTTAGHTTAMHSYNHAYADKVLNLAQRANLNFVANPLSNTSLMGRFDSYPKRRGITRVREILEKDLNISLGHDNIMDPFYGLGMASMLQVANMCAHVCQMTGSLEMKHVFDMITLNGAKTLQIEDVYGLEVGKPANLVLLDARNEMDAIRRMTTATKVISLGRVVASTEPVRTRVMVGSDEEIIDYQK